MAYPGKALTAGLGARSLSGSILGFILVFALLYLMLSGRLS